jgi:hypothetical protein
MMAKRFVERIGKEVLMPIAFKLDYVIEKTLKEQGAPERKKIQELAGVKLSNREAREAWPRLLEHQWHLSERLGRDVGCRVAAVDFFDNIYTWREANLHSRRFAHWICRQTLAM